MRSPFLDEYRRRGPQFDTVVAYATTGADLGAVCTLSREFRKGVEGAGGGGKHVARNSLMKAFMKGGRGRDRHVSLEEEEECEGREEKGGFEIDSQCVSMEEAMAQHCRKGGKKYNHGRKNTVSAPKAFLSGGGGQPPTTSKKKATEERFDRIITLIEQTHRSVNDPPPHALTPTYAPTDQLNNLTVSSCTYPTTH